MELHLLSAAVFAPHLNTVFTMVSEDGLEIAATLTDCQERPRSTMRGSPRTAFDLVLECPAEGLPFFNGAAFTLRHPVVGSLGPLHVERILTAPADAGTACFQIIFN
ncbi:hypothetical protein J2847_004306 [Azospirillum agricola]|uniref:DUF6916 family protein n=1 Tax=Azospirillum agricola TaxID=1720247 RepID=UPI001B3BA699|nr:hypothetical protein [Azospirillum agricola]MBP2230995.1 hypothetical protein [Azospirillum agricola]